MTGPSVAGRRVTGISIVDKTAQNTSPPGCLQGVGKERGLPGNYLRVRGTDIGRESGESAAADTTVCPALKKADQSARLMRLHI